MKTRKLKKLIILISDFNMLSSGTHEMRSETKRQIEHIFPIFFCFLLRDLPYRWIMFLSILAVFYGIFGKDLLVKGTHRPEEETRGYSIGKICYAVSVLILLLIFREHLFIAAGGWTFMAIGDASSNLIGKKFGKHTLPWRRAFSWEGFFAFIALSFPAAWGMILFVGYAGGYPNFNVFSILIISALGALGGAIIESVSYKIEDNLTVPIGTALIVWVTSKFLGII